MTDTPSNTHSTTEQTLDFIVERAIARGIEAGDQKAWSTELFNKKFAAGKEEAVQAITQAIEQIKEQAYSAACSECDAEGLTSTGAIYMNREFDEHLELFIHGREKE